MRQNPQTRAHLLGLPVELLAEILQHSRPDSFQAFMLTCKHIYAAGAHLVSEHNFCRKWIKEQMHRGLSYPAYIKSTFEVLLLWIEVEANKRPHLLSYLTRINLDQDGGHINVRSIQHLMDKLRVEEQWLASYMTTSLQDVLSLVPICELHSRNLLECFTLPKS